MKRRLELVREDLAATLDAQETRAAIAVVCGMVPHANRFAEKVLYTEASRRLNTQGGRA